MLVLVPDELGAAVEALRDQAGQVVPPVQFLCPLQKVALDQERVFGQGRRVVALYDAPQGAPVGAGDAAEDVPLGVGGLEGGGVPATDFPASSSRYACTLSTFRLA